MDIFQSGLKGGTDRWTGIPRHFIPSLESSICRAATGNQSERDATETPLKIQIKDSVVQCLNHQSKRFPLSHIFIMAALGVVLIMVC